MQAFQVIGDWADGVAKKVNLGPVLIVGIASRSRSSSRLGNSRLVDQCSIFSASICWFMIVQ